MTTIQLYCRGASAWTKVDGRITRGMVGLNVVLFCDESWDGLTRSLVARNGEGDRWVLAAVGDTAVVPHEALLEEGSLYLCLEGRDADGHLVLPSNWASCGRIYDSGGGEAGTAAATPTELQQLMVLADQARRTAEEALRRTGSSGGGTESGGTADLTGYATENWVNENFGSKTDVQSVASAAAGAGSAASAAQSTANTALIRANQALQAAGNGTGSGAGGWGTTSTRNLLASSFGILTGNSAAANSNAFEAMVDQLIADNLNHCALILEAGTYNFASPITIPAWRIDSVVGIGNTHHNAEPTILHFPNIATGQTAISAGPCSLKNLKVTAPESSYNFLMRRYRTGSGEQLWDETGSVNATGISVTTSTSLDNVFVKNFYTGIKVGMGNMRLNDIWVERAHIGVTIANDVYLTDLHAVNCYIGLEATGNLAHGTNIRGDSIVHLIHAKKGGLYVHGVDADYCCKSIIHIGDPDYPDQIVNAGYYSSIHGRACVERVFPTSAADPYESTDRYSFPADTADCYDAIALVTFEQGTYYGGNFQFANARPGDPIDNDDYKEQYGVEKGMYRCPIAELYAPARAKIIGAHIVTANVYWANASTEDIYNRHVRLDNVTRTSNLGGRVIYNELTVDTGFGSYLINRDPGGYHITNAYDNGTGSGTETGGGISKSDVILTGSIVPNDDNYVSPAAATAALDAGKTVILTYDDGTNKTVFSGFTHSASEAYTGIVSSTILKIYGNLIQYTLESKEADDGTSYWDISTDVLALKSDIPTGGSAEKAWELKSTITTTGVHPMPSLETYSEIMIIGWATNTKGDGILCASRENATSWAGFITNALTNGYRSIYAIIERSNIPGYTGYHLKKGVLGTTQVTSLASTSFNSTLTVLERPAGGYSVIKYINIPSTATNVMYQIYAR